MALVVSIFAFWVLLVMYDWIVRSSDSIAGGLLIGRRRRRKRLVVSGGGVVLLAALLWGGYGWGAETTVISFMVILGFIDDWRDVGLGFVLMGLVLWKIYGGLSWGYLLYFLVMLMDTGMVLMWRLLKRENVFKKHHRHLYQRMVRGLGWHEVLVSIGYAIVQLLVIVCWEGILKTSDNSVMGVVGIVLLLMVSYVLLYRWVVKKEEQLTGNT